MIFVALGVARVDNPLAMALVGHDLHKLIDAGGLVLSVELLRVVTILALLGMTVFAVTALTDEAYQRLFLEDQLNRLRAAISAWAYYSVAVTAFEKDELGRGPRSDDVGAGAPSGSTR